MGLGAKAGVPALSDSSLQPGSGRVSSSRACRQL